MGIENNTQTQPDLSTVQQPRQETILIVDDTPANLDLIGSYLKDYGYKLLYATNGETALRRIERTPPDLILLDVMMPGMDGFETCLKIKANPEVKDIPIIFLTALVDTEQKTEGFLVGGVDYITKPVHKNELLSRVRTHLEIHRYRNYLEEEVERKTQELQQRTSELETANRDLKVEVFERKHVENELKRINAVIENTSDGVAIIMPNYKPFYMNPALRKLTGKLENSYAQTHISQLHPQWAYDIIEKEAIPYATEHGVWMGETALIRYDQQEVPVSQVIIPHKTSDDSTLYFSTIIRDISEYRNTLKALQESDAQLTAALSAAEMGTWRFDITSNKSLRDASLNKILGLTPDKTVQSQADYLNRIYTDDRLRVEKNLDKCIDQGTNFTEEYRIVRPDKSIRWVSDKAILLTDDVTQQKYIVGAIVDITKQKENESRRHQSEERFQQIAENISEVFILLEKNKENKVSLLYINPICEKMFGISPETLYANPKEFLSIIHEDDKKTVSYSNFETLFTTSLDEEFRVVSQDFTRWVHQRSYPIPSSSPHNAQRVAIIAGEITDRKEAQEASKEQHQQLIQADKMVSLGILVSGVGHEINNPNNYILPNAQIMRTAWENISPILDEYLSTHGDFEVAGIPYSEAKFEIHAIISGIIKGAERIKAIVKSLRDFASPKEESEFEITSINDVVKETLILTKSLIRKATSNFNLNLTEDIPDVHVNSQQIEQVFINMITNACQSLKDSHKKVEIATSFDTLNNVILVKFIDEGNGIPPENLKRIMDPFFTTKRNKGGTGLGLPISYKIIKEHKGDIHFASTVGVGTTVTISLPRHTWKT